MRKQVKVIISGDVIGVFFRAFIKQDAVRLNVNGWVRNRNDKVEAVFNGEEDSVKRLIELCKIGPPYAKVEDVKVEEMKKSEKFDDLRIVY